MWRVVNGDCSILLSGILKDEPNAIIVSDPPFNQNYHYRSYKDRRPDDEYWSWLAAIFSQAPAVVIHYPEKLYRLSQELNCVPEKVVSWVYNSHNPKQHRDVAFFKIKPDFRKVLQPYKNPNDKRIKARIERGILGGRLYDWWNINQVKNVNKDKTSHPCQMPLEVMTNIIGILPEDALIIDPFCGSGTTGVACKKLGRDFVGIEIDEEYAQLSRNRIESCSYEPNYHKL